MRRERDELAMLLSAIEAYEPGITAKAWAAQIVGQHGGSDQRQK